MDSSGAEAPVREGDVLADKYRVDRVLGMGGMGVVVAATHLQLERRVAVKFMLPAALAVDKDALGRFQREAKVAVQLSSEHVAKVLDTGSFADGTPYIVMEYLEGEDLGERLKLSTTFAVSSMADFIIQACDAIAEAHSLGLVHRDLKPANLFMTKRRDGTPLIKVLDFGISKSMSIGDGNLALTKTTTMLGSPLYMSPEQMRSAKKVDQRTDIWSLGIIMYELLGGRVPFDSDTLGDLL
jgi:serine/threonine-protein kinase